MKMVVGCQDRMVFGEHPEAEEPEAFVFQLS